VIQITNNTDDDNETTENWYFHISKSVTEHEDITVLWNQGVQTNGEIVANRPGIIVLDKMDRTCLLVVVTMSSDGNVIQKVAAKKLKHKNLSMEVQRMWKMECFVIPVMIGAIGIVSKSLKNIWKQYQDNIQYIPYKKTVILGTSHIIRKVLQAET
jgi:hypothetical protein